VKAGAGGSTIIAYVTDAGSNPVTDGTVVNFSTNLGTLDDLSVPIIGGFASTDLPLSNPSTEDTINATVTAISSPAIANITPTCPLTPLPAP